MRRGGMDGHKFETLYLGWVELNVGQSGVKNPIAGIRRHLKNVMIKKLRHLDLENNLKMF